MVSRLREMGIEPLIVDAGIRGEPDVPVYVTRRRVAEKGNTTLEAVQAIPHEGKALNAMIVGAIAVAREMLEADNIRGALAIGGSMGTTLGTAIMRSLPFGFPKVMVSTMASRNTRAFVGTKDILMLHSVCDLAGVNRMTRKVLRNGAAALAGMVLGRSEGPSTDETLPQVALSTLGTTESCAVEIRRALAEAGWEVVTFHTNGSGGQAMDEMIQEGEFDAVIDLSLHEITDNACGGEYDSGPERALPALRQGVPTVLVPGNMDFIVTGTLAETQKRYPGRATHSHNEAISVVKTSPEEMATLGRLLAQRCSEAKGPLAVLVPAEGLSAFGHRQGPLYDPEGTRRFLEAFRSEARDPALLRVVPAHINDPEFARALLDAFFGIWKPGGAD